MNQSKGSTANTEADASKDTSKHNPFSNILKSGEADKLGSKSQGKVLYEIAQKSEDKQQHIEQINTWIQQAESWESDLVRRKKIRRGKF